MPTDKAKEIVNKLCETITKAELTPREVMSILPEFLFSVGASLEKCDLQSNEEVLKRYAQRPTYGNALMAQALWMKEIWVKSPEREEE